MTSIAKTIGGEIYSTFRICIHSMICVWAGAGFWPPISNAFVWRHSCWWFIQCTYYYETLRWSVNVISRWTIVCLCARLFICLSAYSVYTHRVSQKKKPQNDQIDWDKWSSGRLSNWSPFFVLFLLISDNQNCLFRCSAWYLWRQTLLPAIWATHYPIRCRKYFILLNQNPKSPDDIYVTNPHVQWFIVVCRMAYVIVNPCHCTLHTIHILFPVFDFRKRLHIASQSCNQPHKKTTVIFHRQTDTQRNISVARMYATYYFGAKWKLNTFACFYSWHAYEDRNRRNCLFFISIE